MRAIYAIATLGLWAVLSAALTFAPFVIAVALVVLVLRWMGVIQ